MWNALQNLCKTTHGNMYPGLGTILQKISRYYLIETFRIMKELNKFDREKFIMLTTSKKTRGHNLKLSKLSLKKALLIHKTFFSLLVTNVWNDLPQFVIDSRTVNQY